MTQQLNYMADNFDQENTFSFEYVGFRGVTRRATGYLFNCEKENKIYILQKSAYIKSHYTEADNAERTRLNTMTAVKTGDIVEVEGKKYEVKILGDYSDAGRLIPIAA
ncbi:hypothetical protein [Synechococcus phage BUCT-ZZ01]|nr:hypothetical protein [Synechococcus phage BUCT-ZZ01]